ncbi:MAG: hypothetical protein DRQ64_06915 [Gammaproteobacteria bacterium]|nr:MAG: hypothetical protein DRQ64_06915 [Gammaproteobacteria bacterium]
MRGIALSAKKSASNNLLRSLIPILYAHWEGFVKQVSIAKLTYLVSKGIKYKDLNESFLAYAAFEAFGGQIPVKRFDAISKIAKGDIGLDSPIKLNPEKYIDTKSNLNSEVLKEISLKVGIDYALFELKENMIDEGFLGLRNQICHGERVSVTKIEFDNLYAEVIGLIDLFKNLVLNSVHTKSYLKEAA